MEGKEDTITGGQIQELVFAGDPGEYTILVLRLALSGLKLSLVPNRRVKQYDSAQGERAWACLCLLSRTAIERCSSPQMQAVAVDLIASQSEGICRWFHWHAASYVNDTQATSSDTHRKAYMDLARILLDLLDVPGILDAFMATCQYLALFLHLWTTKDDQSLYLIDMAPEGEPILSLLMLTVDNTGGNIRGFDRLLERLASSKLEASSFAMAYTGRVTQVRRLVSSSDPPKEVWTFSRNLISLLERILDVGDASHMDRRSFDKSKFISECALLLYSIAIAFEQEKVPEGARFSIYDLVPLLQQLSRSTDRNYRVPHSCANLVVGKIDATYARIALSNTRDPDPANQRLLATLLAVLEMHTVHPVVLESILVQWGEADQDPVRVTAVQAPADTSLKSRLRQFMFTGAMRAELYGKFRAFKSLSICDNSSCGGAKRHTSYLSRQCTGCSSVIYCSLECQKVDWERHHRSECVYAKAHHNAQRSRETWYSHRTRAFHEWLLASDFSARSSDFLRDKSATDTANSSRHPIITYWTVGGALIEHEMVNYRSEHWANRPQIQYPQHYLVPRIRSLGRKYSTAAKSSSYGDLLIVEGIFPLIPLAHQVHLIALLKRIGPQYEVVYSIARRGIRQVGSTHAPPA